MPGHQALVIQTGFLGDLVLTLPLLRALRRARPDLRLTLMVRAGLGELVAEQPGVVAALEVPKRRGWARRLIPDLKSLRKLRRGGFDTVYLAHRSFRTGLYAWSTRAPQRIGLAGTAAGWACTRTVDFSGARHVAARQLSLAGIDPGDALAELVTPAYEVTARARNAAAALLERRGLPSSGFMSLAPGSVWPTKRWTPEGFARIARHIAALQTPVALIGTASEHALCEQVRSAAGNDVVNLAGETTPSELAALLAVSRLCLGNDSGPGHLARAVGTPVVSIFGPTDPDAGFRPLGDAVLTIDIGDGLDCRPCSVHGSLRCPQRHHRCMQDLQPEAVLARITSWRSSPWSSPGTPRAPHE